ncbi:MAG: uncharacterized protein QOJ32_1348 [Frankiaceae bacterium]|jgi:hypothetical protein|nr:uncharacterized protein [Frankiaceae bacterium]MDQ1634539.1 uncharacterized protein [Frankiaceae bacterium]MDQ1674022.1 uncharacterized protein [Frankiaceae bacterium]
MSRPRDDAGRPRQDRPRDRLGRPLPRDGEGLDAAVEPVPDELDLSPEDALAYAQRLLDERRPFGAHEVLEAVWKASPPGEEDLWRALAQLAVAATHLERGNPTGAQALFSRAADGLATYRGQVPHGIAVDSLLEVASAGAARAWSVPDAGPAFRLTSYFA